MPESAAAYTARRQTRLAIALEAADICYQLAQANPRMYLAYLTESLNRLSDRLTEEGRNAEAGNKWETAIASLHENSSKLALSLAYARYLISRSNADQAIVLLAQIATSPDAPGPVVAAARKLLRTQWRHHTNPTQQAWQSVSPAPVPDWVRLNEDDIHLVTGWIDTRTWAESRDYLQRHAERLLAPATTTVLAEVALTTPAGLIDQHRALLDAAREGNLDTAYRPLLMDETLRNWIEASDWPASESYLRDHPALLDEDIPDRLRGLGAPDALIAVHQSLLTLARGAAGIEAAYAALADEQALKALAGQAIAGRHSAQVDACGVIATLVHNRALTGGLYIALATLLTDPPVTLPDGLADQLREIALQAESAERDSVVTEFDTLITNVPVETATADEVRRALAGIRGPSN